MEKMERMVFKDHKAQWDHKDQQALKDVQEKMENKDSKDLLDKWGQWDLWDHKEKRVTMDYKVSQEMMADQEKMQIAII